jgi:hypothetical protein
LYATELTTVDRFSGAKHRILFQRVIISSAPAISENARARKNTPGSI